MFEKYGYNGSEFAQAHLSGMYKIDMKHMGLEITPISEIKTRIMCLNSDIDPLLEIRDNDEEKEIGMITNHVHEL